MSTFSYIPTPKNIPVPVVSGSLPNASSYRFLSDFTDPQILGRGAFGKVVKVRNRLDGQYYAIKKIKLSKRNTSSNTQMLREVLTFSRLSHPNVVRYYQAWIEDGVEDDEEDDEEGSFTSESGTDQTSRSTTREDDSQWEPIYRFDSDEEEKLSGRKPNSEPVIKVEKAGSYSCAVPRTCKICLDDYLQPVDMCQGCYTAKLLEKSSIDLDCSSDFQPGQCLFIQMEFCQLTLRDTINNHTLWERSEEEIWRLFRQIVEGLAYLHSSDIVHRDLKPDNIFFGRGKTQQYDVLKIGDFGLATSLGESASLSTSRVGTFLYTSPEMNSRPSRYDEKVDIYALGIVLFEMWRPFKTAMERCEVLETLRRELKFPDDFATTRHVEVQSLIHSLVRRLLNPNPIDRPSALELLGLIPFTKSSLRLARRSYSLTSSAPPDLEPEKSVNDLKKELAAAKARIEALTRENDDQRVRIVELTTSLSAYRTSSLTSALAEAGVNPFS
eukprot:TRINITY_DN5239_c0_g1_i1.p1 TRINITY_DN5239_c0_g1~~TRINITY_DN5239_c0_g1_i1.p1  ORF type:complete len:497 (-),score=88.51 TRINITY_DN5239_c0_g1_i1:107-1597(-)